MDNDTGRKPPSEGKQFPAQEITRDCGKPKYSRLGPCVQLFVIGNPRIQ